MAADYFETVIICKPDDENIVELMNDVTKLLNERGDILEDQDFGVKDLPYTLSSYDGWTYHQGYYRVFRYKTEEYVTRSCE